MTEKRIDAGKSPNVRVTCQGNLSVRGWNEPTVLMKDSEYTHNTIEEWLDIQSSGDLNMYLPFNSNLSILRSSGDALVKMVDGTLVINEVMGDVNIRNAGDIDIVSVYGDTTVRHVNGQLSVQKIMGDLSVRNAENIEIDTVFGDCALRFVNGIAAINQVSGDISLRTVNSDINVSSGQRDLNLRNIGGKIQISEISGDIRLIGGLPGGKHSLNAHGDVVIRWPADQPIQLDVTAADIKNELALENKIEETGYLSGHLGDGNSVLVINAKGRVVIKEVDVDQKDIDEDMEIDFDLDMMGIGHQIADEMNNKMAEWTDRMERKFGPAFAAKMEKRAQKAAARAEKAAEKAARRAEKAVRKARYHSGQSSWIPSTKPENPETNKKRTVSEQEQLKILRMVESGIISPDEANTLLEALEG